MARTVTTLAAGLLLAGPCALAFASGGYFDEARLWAALAGCAALAAAALVTPRPLPRTRGGRLALGGLAALAAWTALSIGWADIEGPAFHDAQRVVLYLLALAAASIALRERELFRAAEPALAAGCVVVIGYALSGRLLPGVVDQTVGAGAAGRLDQPLTYWNAVGAVAAIGLVLCARLIGDRSRPAWMATAAAAACVPLGMGLYLTFSRGAVLAAATGFLVLAALLPERRQLMALALAAVAAGLGALAAAPFDGVASLQGDSERDGAIVLALLALVATGSALAMRALGRRDQLRPHGDGHLSVPVGTDTSPSPRLLAIAGIAAVIALFVIATSASETRNAATGATASRLTSVQSHRYAYWKVAARAFADHPVKGLGAGGFGGEWLSERTFREGVRDAHSLYLETAAELGLAGLAALAVLIAGIALAARRVGLPEAAGPVSGIAAFAAQAGVEWLWEMPAVSLLALVLAGALIARGEAAPTAER